VVDTEGEEVIGDKKKIVNRILFQMKSSIFFILILSSGVLSEVLENLLRLREFIINIYQQFPHGCIFITDHEAQKNGEY
jgi:hypothetical protein